MSKAVNHPNHYTRGSIECIDAIQSALTPEQFSGFLQGNAIKYMWRCQHKENCEEDLRKAQWYLNKMIECNTASSHPNVPPPAAK